MLVLVDGSGYIFRAYYALPPLNSPNNIPVGAVYGFCNMLLKLIEEHKNDHLLVVFDYGKKTFRNDIYSQYKANRSEPPTDLIPQFPLFRTACDAFGVPYVQVENFEADDLIASYTKEALKQNLEVKIISGDKDLMQLMQDGVSIFDPVKQKTITNDDVMKKFGVSTDKIKQVQALCGDASDNIPGVFGIGPKGAAELINQYNSVENLYNNIENLKPSKRKENLINNKENAFVSLKLVELDENVVLPINISEIQPVKTNKSELTVFLNEFGFSNLKKRLIKADSNQNKINAIIIDDIELLKNVLDIAAKEKYLIIDTETTNLNTRLAQIVGIALAIPDQNDKDKTFLEKNWQTYYIPISHKSNKKQLPLDDIRTLLDKVFLDNSIIKIAHNFKYDMAVFNNNGFAKINNIEDTMLISYCLNLGKHSHALDELALIYLNHTCTSYNEVTNNAKICFDEVEVELAANYSAEDVYICAKLFQELYPQLKTNNLEYLYNNIEKPLINVLIDMEKTGVLIDLKTLEENKTYYLQKEEELKNKIIQEVGFDFNIGSVKQLGEVLFEHLKLEGAKKNKSGTYSTDIDVLEKLAQNHTIAKNIIEWRSVNKLISTYVEGLKTAINQEKNTIHTNYSMIGTVTGRLASSNPNVQNIPIKTQDGQKIRKCFIAPQNYQMVSFDYSQIELRLLAHFADEPELIKAFNNNEDIHTITAAKIFNIDFKNVNKEQRRKAKAVNFGIVYGISALGLSKQLMCSAKDAQKIIDDYFSNYSNIKNYIEDQKNFASTNGYVETIFHRRCYLKGINDKNPMLRQFAQRQAVNAPLQGSNADIIKKAMIEVFNFLQNYQSKIIIQVHDELVLQIKDSEIEFIESIKNIMQNTVKLKVPLIVNYTCGNSWI